MNENPLADVHRRLGAEREEEAGLFPAFYTDPVEERRQVREGCGLIDLSERGLIRFAGRDRLTFLQGMVSNDTRMLEEPGTGLYATILNAKGHMLGDLTFFAFPDYLLADTEPGMAPALARLLDRYLIREKVTISLEEQASRVGVSGPKAAEVIQSLLPGFSSLPAPFGCVALEWSGHELRIMRRDFTGEESYLLAVPHEQVVPFWETLTEAGAVPFGQEALETLRVEAGIPRYGRDTSQEVIPLEAALYFGISRDKGCYVGQEIIERISSRGHTNRRLVPLMLEPGPVPPPGAKIHFGERETGRITSAVYSPGLGRPIGLGYVRHDASKPGTTLRVEGPDGETTAEALERPAFGSGQPPAVQNADPVW